MITTERLEELIRQEEWVWLIDEKQRCYRLKLNTNFHIKDNSLRSEVETVYATLDKIFENQDRADWYCKTTAERTERFDPPMWKDLLEKDLYAFTFVKDGEVYDFICSIYLDKVDIRLEQRLVGYSSKPVTTCQFDDATKENYEKACEIVRGLFSEK